MDYLNIFYQNVRGLRTKTHLLYNNVLCNNYDIIILTETWLNSSINSCELFDSRYVVYRRDREICSSSIKKDGGGVLIAVSQKYASQRIFEYESSCEDLWVSLNVSLCKSVKKLNICAIYLPPPVQQFTLNNFIVKCNSIIDSSESLTCIVGDFNLSSIDWLQVQNIANFCQTSRLSQELIDFCYTNNLTQINCIKNSKDKILDLVLLNVPQSEVTSANGLCAADPLHPPLEIVLKAHNETKLAPARICQHNFWKGDYESINAFLDGKDWDELLKDCIDVNEAINKFYNVLREAIREYIPFVTKSNTKKHPPWFDKTLIRLLKEKNLIRKRFKKYKNPLDELAFTLLRKRCDKLAIEKYNTYIKQAEEQIARNPKYFWTYIKSKRGGKGVYPSSMTDGEVVCTDGTDICNLFAKQFTLAYAKSSHHSNSKHTSDILSGADCLSSVTVSRESVLIKLKGLDPFKGAGPDGIPSGFVLSCASALATPLTLLYNMSLSSGIFPTVWKQAKVVPVMKSGNTNEVGNYRPISILSCFGKIFESLICPLLQDHFKKYLSVHQHGFVKSRSTNSNLVSFVEYLIENLDTQKQIDVIYTDFSKAFDRISHSILIDKLAMYGITGKLLEWFGSYLADRSFYVVVNGFRSEDYEISSGVPQGSHLGPILFVIFVNDISACFVHSTPFLFADDLKFASVIESSRDVQNLQSDVDALFEWCTANCMDLNTKKCLHIKVTRKIKSIPSSYSINNETLTESRHVKDLGVFIDSKLTFIPHMEHIIKKASGMLGFIIRNGRMFRKSKTKIMLYNSLVRSVLEYCSVAWRPHYATHSLRLERIQKRFLWHLAGRPSWQCKISYEKTLERFQMVSLEKRRNKLDLMFLFKLLRNHTDCPLLLSKIKFKVPFRYPRYKTKPLTTPRRRTKLGSNSPLYRLSNMYNKLSDNADIHHDSMATFSKLTNSF